jgi:lipopolysaccharide heptosyltransferase II
VHLRILIIRLSSLGDIILTLPVIDALRTKYPEATIDFVTKKEYGGLVRRFAAVSNVYELDTKHRRALDHLHNELRARHYDHVLDLHNNLRSRKLRNELSNSIHIVNKRTLKRWTLVKFKVNLLRNEPDIVGRYFETVSSLDVADTHEGAYLATSPHKSARVALAPGAKHWNKRWPMENYIALAKDLTKKGYAISIFGSEAESKLAEEIVAAIPTARNECGKHRIEELPDALGECALFIGNDSGLMHIAAAIGMPTVAIYGPTVREFGFMPRNRNVKILEVEGLDCRPCTTIGLKDCPKGHFRCMKETTPAQVLTTLSF